MNELKTICVFCGGNAGSKAIYTEMAAAMGQELGARGMNFVYGGGSVGLMGVVARAARDHGCAVVMIRPAARRRPKHRGSGTGFGRSPKAPADREVC